MTGNFKLVRKISFRLPMYSSLPVTFENVYIDRFNSIFKGFYLLIAADDITIDKIDSRQRVIFTKVRSTERFGAGLRASDIVFVDVVDNKDLSDDEIRTITYLNQSVNNNTYRTTE